MAHRNFARAMRRKTQWGGFGDATPAALFPDWTTVTSGAVVLLSQGIVISGGLGLVDEEFTVTRTIGQVSVAMGTDTALADARLAVGL